ncbi:MAG: Chemotaxis protein cheY, partial [Candidatus Magnetoglobus multicellularis str. Araruama]
MLSILKNKDKPPIKGKTMTPENIKILLVDDFKSTRNLERSMLHAVGYTNVVDAEDGDDAINKLQQEGDIDLIISDWNMPNRNGYELLVWVREHEKYKHIPFIMATAQSEKRNDQSLKS